MSQMRSSIVSVDVFGLSEDSLQSVPTFAKRSMWDFPISNISVYLRSSVANSKSFKIDSV